MTPQIQVIQGLGQFLASLKPFYSLQSFVKTKGFSLLSPIA